MAKAHSIGTQGQGWHKQPLRHSNARKTGTAGGTYAGHPNLITFKSVVEAKKYEAQLKAMRGKFPVADYFRTGKTIERVPYYNDVGKTK